MPCQDPDGSAEWVGRGAAGCPYRRVHTSWIDDISADVIKIDEDGVDRDPAELPR
jgi:hypothetical protein